MTPESRAPLDPDVQAGARLIAEAFDASLARDRELVHAAKELFERADWAAVQHDSIRRLDLYNDAVNEGLAALRERFGSRLEERSTWSALRTAYAAAVAGRGDVDVAETFFNSCTRRIFHTIGVDPSVEFVSTATSEPASPATRPISVRFENARGLVDLFTRVLEHYRFDVPWDDADGDARRAAEAVEHTHLGESILALELAQSVFYRAKGAYLVGRLHLRVGPVPFLLALTNPEGRIVVDAVLLTADEVSIVFSFARTYFRVEMECPRELVEFLRTIMPRKPLGELYNAIGWNKHGKTELYRSILHHLATSDDRFEIAPGQRGMVMSVFTLPGFDVVFKVIRDRFLPPKTVTHAEVREKYRMVFRHDRAGRLVDAQEFEHLAFDRARFDPELLLELTSSCAERVEVRGESVVISHLYTERRLRPLDMYLREASPEAARDALVDYGQVLRDLAATNIFPGDMLLKNFGVSRHGRLIFYDYDELCRLDECRFRSLPTARDDDEETAGEPWFYVSERDIFPEEFRSFLGLPPDLLAAFLEHHGELLTPAFWTRMQELHERGEILDIYPYRSARRLRWRTRSSNRSPDNSHSRSEAP